MFVVIMTHISERFRGKELIIKRYINLPSFFFFTILVFQNVSVETSGFIFNCNCNF